MSIKTSSSGRIGGGSAIAQAIQKIIDREVDSYAQRYKTALTKAMKDIVQQSVRTWHGASGLSTGEMLASAVNTESAFVRTTKDHKVIRVTSYFDSGTIDSMSSLFPDAGRWAGRHPELCTMSVGAYIFFLRWDLGITALPEKANFTGSGWVNPNFQMSSLGPMQSYCLQEVMNNLIAVAGMPGMMRGRNQSMGAGINSSNRGGMSNLVHGKGGGT